MIDHLGFSVSDLARSSAFYVAALAPLGITEVMRVTPEETGAGSMLGYGKDGKPFFWIGDEKRVGAGIHVAFAVDTRSEVDAFYAAALAAGGIDNGPPGIRAHYHPNYYAAFVRDPDGQNIEAVCQRPE
ncbi:VOC family protein [Sphingomonas gei]|uniref:VOC family protein n=1 Tax=Sphingomonas gei TaxID=1395960 RepID=A0A4S1XJQ6_9SPHN|nr:VOC family protein [Sphingomonas gei]TGX56093.1 VOC family protein [Sphingomonas gei]